MRPDPVLGLLGLAQKAGCVKSGEFMAENMIKEGKSFLCITATDASDNTKKHFNVHTVVSRTRSIRIRKVSDVR